MKTLLSFVAAVSVLLAGLPAAADPLPSWNDGPARDRIIAFVDAVTTPGGPDYVTPDARVAVFDNDGTLWAEQPFYFQVFFAMDTLAARAEQHPDLLTSETLRGGALGDLDAVLAGGVDALMELIAVSHSGISVDAFTATARDWLATATHPVTGRPFGDHVYQPMLELLRYLRDEEFETYIVSGGGLHLIRAFAEDAYGIPPENVVGSVGASAYEIVDGVPTIMKLPGIAFVDDGAGKPVAIDRNIGRRPILAVGNSDGDFEMLEWTTAGDGPRLGVFIHHTDAVREFAYDRESHAGRLDRGIDEAPSRDWLVVDMAADWARVFAWEE